MDIKQAIKEIEKLDVTPVPFEQGASLWDDDYISVHMLGAHLDDTNNKASYQSGLRKKAVEKIIKKCGLSEGCSLLDLGCGPGLYAKEFAARGIHYTGIDISRQSLGYAMAHKGKFADKISYVQADYSEYDFTEKYDCIVMIWCDFGALSLKKRDIMLKKIQSSLKPGGFFCFDVYAAESPFKQTKSFWRAECDGFWQKGEYLVLERNIYYETINTALHHAIVASDSGVKSYKIWDKRYSKKELCKLLCASGFGTVRIAKGGLSGVQREMLGVFCKRNRLKS